jgi:tRNA(fMet)-specific endonuclease VapC
MTHLLDTNACVNYLRGSKDSKIAERLAAAGLGTVALCSVVKAELLYGAERSLQAEKNHSQLVRFFAP